MSTLKGRLVVRKASLRTACATSFFLLSACSAGTDDTGGTTRPQGPGPANPGADAAVIDPGDSGDTDAGISLDGSLSDAKKDEECDNILEVTYRDFTEDHPDFEMAFSGDVVRLELVEATLGIDKKPVFRDSIGCPREGETQTCANWQPTQAAITSAETFAQWYRDTDGVNQRFERTLELAEEVPGSGTYVFDSTEFFPLGPSDGFGITPPNHKNQNFLFTTEIHLLFKYVAGQKFTFRGDDDLWIFVNKKLALDLGSMHFAASGTIDFDAQATELGITPGGTYPMDIFHAERHTMESNFRFETNIACFEPVIVR
jgi:fibro-slime domain-containing protein